MKQITLSVSILSCCICGCVHAQNKSDDHIVMVKSADLEMNSAIQEARASLPKFWSAFNSNAPHLEDFALKVAIHDGEKTEHFWINNIQKSDGKLFGFIANDPELVTTPPPRYSLGHQFGDDSLRGAHEREEGRNPGGRGNGGRP